ncbi:hypothetical protein BKA82DRAFT_998542 [Pisolithus tinctorius]|uniref:Uncharacterized protein n=1 Tax=Pisolithus tinctorius Marx 270 TaxID=870435 RepID=A0A0C3PFP0_PISTI|nr:hypothetical protein BKA82DRAFT_998542 [Pisolithus tinctorius]KIO07121.1 hypothetical protein M404DRAFT_998542 [Pisolithus tinctorius Marx 270]
MDALLWYINSYVTVMGVLCATLWFSGSEWVQTRSQPLSGDVFSFKTNLRTVHDRKSESEIGAVDKWSSTPCTADLDAGPATHCKQPATLAEEEKYCTM